MFLGILNQEPVILENDLCGEQNTEKTKNGKKFKFRKLCTWDITKILIKLVNQLNHITLVGFYNLLKH